MPESAAVDVVVRSFAVIDWIVVAAYFGAMLLIGWWASRGQHDEGTFFLGGRKMPAWAVSLSVLATALSAATFIGAPEIGFGGNYTYLILNIGEVVSAFIVAYLFLPPIYHAGTITIYGYLGKRFGEESAMAAGGMFLLGRLLASGARLFMAGIGFSLVLYGDASKSSLLFAIVLLGLIGTLYTSVGGIKAVIWTDVLQILVVVFAAGLSVYLLLDAIPLSFGEIIGALREAPKEMEGGTVTVNKMRLVDTSWSFSIPYTIWAGIIASTFISSATYGADHDMAQRLLTTKSPLHSGMALIASKLIGIPVVFLFLFIGSLLYIFYTRPDLMGEAAPWDLITGEKTKQIYPQFLLNHLPVGIRGLAMAGLFAAAMSSFDSAINAMASAAIGDIYLPLRRRKGLPVDKPADVLASSRWAVVLMGVLLTLFAMGSALAFSDAKNTLIGFALGVMAFALAPLLGVFATALFTRRGNLMSVAAALAVGFAVVLLLQGYFFCLPALYGFEIGWTWIWPIASLVSFVYCVAGAPEKPACA